MSLGNWHSEWNCMRPHETIITNSQRTETAWNRSSRVTVWKIQLHQATTFYQRNHRNDTVTAKARNEQTTWRDGSINFERSATVLIPFYCYGCSCARCGIDFRTRDKCVRDVTDRLSAPEKRRPFYMLVIVYSQNGILFICRECFRRFAAKIIPRACEMSVFLIKLSWDIIRVWILKCDVTLC